MLLLLLLGLLRPDVRLYLHWAAEGAPCLTAVTPAQRCDLLRLGGARGVAGGPTAMPASLPDGWDSIDRCCTAIGGVSSLKSSASHLSWQGAALHLGEKGVLPRVCDCPSPPHTV
jgi:hypothetical protein